MGRDSPSSSPSDAARLRAAFHAVVRRFGLLDTSHTGCGRPLAVSHAHALIELRRAAGVVQRDLAATLGLSKSAVSRIVRRLESRGWVQRERSADDGRERRLSLTRSGRRLAEDVDEASILHFTSLVDGIPPRRRAAVVSALETLARAIDPCAAKVQVAGPGASADGRRGRRG